MLINIKIYLALQVNILQLLKHPNIVSVIHIINTPLIGVITGK